MASHPDFKCPECGVVNSAMNVMICFEHHHPGVRIELDECPFCGGVINDAEVGKETPFENHLKECPAYAACLLHPGCSRVIQLSTVRS